MTRELRDGMRDGIRDGVTRDSSLRERKTDALAVVAERLGRRAGKLISEAAQGDLGGVLRDVLTTLGKSVKEQLDPDHILGNSMAACIEFSASRYALDPGDQWKPGSPLKMLLAGYAGTRNTGADVRVEEMIRQFRHIFDDSHLDLSILTMDAALTRGYFRTVKQLALPRIFPKFLTDVIHDQHGVIACEGSMFKSKFANALSVMMVGALGVAGAENKLAIGYGGEAGAMDPKLAELVRTYCKNALIVVRNPESADVLRKLGVASKPGTDTAWTFTPAPAAVGQQLLRDAGWDGETPILSICPINPFWWPVKPDVVKGVLHATTGAHANAHYDSVYFHHSGAEVERKQRKYLEAIATGYLRFAEGRKVFPILVGMEQLDRRAAEALSDILHERGAPRPALFVSDDHDMYTLVSVIRQSSMMLASRYHACVTSMPGLVASAGVTMDERIRNLMADRGQPHLALECSDPELADRVYDVLVCLDRDKEQIREGIGRAVVSNLERMGRMGMYVVDHVRAKHPEFPFRATLGGEGDPWKHLPPFSNDLHTLVERFAPASAPKASEHSTEDDLVAVAQ